MLPPNTVQTEWVSRYQPKIWRRLQKNWQCQWHQWHSLLECMQIWRFDDDIAGLGRQGESSAHCWILLGAWICQLPHPPPGFLSAGQVTTDWVEMQATDIFTYNMTHCPGAENTATASVLLDTIVRYSHFLFWVSNPGNFSTFITRDFHPIFVKPKNYIVIGNLSF